jgi:hypothetical protein
VNTVSHPHPAVCKTLDKTNPHRRPLLYKNTAPSKNFIKNLKKPWGIKKPPVLLQGAERFYFNRGESKWATACTLTEK